MAAKESVDFFKGHVLPPSAMARLVEANDSQPFPEKITFPNVAQDQWTTRALTRGLWKDKVPKFSVLWLSDPDYSQHESGPGSATALGNGDFTVREEQSGVPEVDSVSHALGVIAERIESAFPAPDPKSRGNSQRDIQE